MRLEGRCVKDGRGWLAEIPMLDAMTQARTRRGVFEMTADLVRTLAGTEDLEVIVHGSRDGSLEVEVPDDAALIALLLRRRRQAAGLTLAGAAERLGQTSRNAFARYEQGKAVPSVTRLAELLRALDSRSDFVIRESRMPYGE